MRRSLALLFFVLMLFVFPLNVAAQTSLTLESLQIQLWPDYDRPAVLAIYDFSLDATTKLPVTLSFRMPGDAELQAVAKGVNNDLLTVESQTSTVQDGYKSVSFTVNDRASYHLEYYLPYTRTGATRNFVFHWLGDYATKALTIVLQEPSGAKNITTNPALPDVGPGLNNLIYRSLVVKQLAAQQVFELEVNYQNDSDTLSASTLSVQPSTPLDQNVSGQVSLTSYIPWVILGLGLIVILGGVGWYLLSGRSSQKSFPPRRRRPAKAKDNETVDSQIYCHQCGKRAQPGDAFCRTCGTHLRQGEL